jgi:hypothetical protein
MSVPKGVAGNAAHARKTRKNNRPLEDEKKHQKTNKFTGPLRSLRALGWQRTHTHEFLGGDFDVLNA